MAFRLNHLFQTAPQQFLERTAVFMKDLDTTKMRSKLTHFIDLEPVADTPHSNARQARARVLEGPHQYQQDAPLPAYFLQSGTLLTVPRNSPAHRFIFVSDFTCCRLLISSDGEDNMRLLLEDNLAGRLPAPDASKYLDCFAYWDHIPNNLLGNVHGTTVLYKQPDEPWTVVMQVIVGIPRNEMVHQAIIRRLSV